MRLCVPRRAGGCGPALHEVGGVLVGIGVVTSFILIIRSGWSVGIDTALFLVAASVLVVFVGWEVVEALFSSGRSAAAVGAGAVAIAFAVAGIAYAAHLGSSDIAASDVPVPLLALGMLTPGVATLVIVGRMPRQDLRDDGDDSQWLRRSRVGLRARLIPVGSVHDHVAEIEQALADGEASAYSEFGHPLTLVHELAAADKTSRIRRWASSIAAAAGMPSFVAVVVTVNQSWGCRRSRAMSIAAWQRASLPMLSLSVL